jgi:hypothetical protein
MDPKNKPEWFQLAESDGGLPHRKAKRGFRALALAVPLMAIGIGVVVAQTSNESPASAETTSVAATQAPQVTTSPVASQAVSSPTKLNQAAQSSQPAIAVPPVGGGDDNEDDEYGDDGNEDDEYGEDD